ncbi:hypothetical protein [Microbacterium sp. RURRCA19A]|uniref:hypothetical protein n=1 Tax=Microbacterium sp. RURRCA19A TaxID=1907391 RepID=UPI000953E46E|nr:hypothetical protein [Microbacterium sp. RURRCA19A]SIR52293.1 hypothetical protein SAMN05880568_0302 [Microbacterium sp. RURRCA19A]
MMRRRLAVIIAVGLVSCGIVAVAAVFLLRSATGLFDTVDQAIADSADGEVLAARAVRDTADDLTSSLGYVQRSVDAETRAATMFTASTGAVIVTPVVWSGGGSSDGPAIVDVRIDAEIAAVEGALWAKGNSSGSAAGCYRFTIPVGAYARSEPIDCPAAAAPAEPPVTTTPAVLPADAEERVRAALAAGDASVDSVRAAFPEPSVTVEVTTTDAGETVAAVGVPASRDCVVLVRRSDGVIDPVDFRRISLEPGEAGCSTTLYTNPPF